MSKTKTFIFVIAIVLLIFINMPEKNRESGVAITTYDTNGNIVREVKLESLSQPKFAVAGETLSKQKVFNLNETEVSITLAITTINTGNVPITITYGGSYFDGIPKDSSQKFDLDISTQRIITTPVIQVS